MSTAGVAPQHKKSRTIDPKKVRLSIMALIVSACFVALFSRLWYLQVLAVDELTAVARDNRVRTVEYEPPRGRLLDRHGNPLVESKRSLAVSLKRSLLENPLKKSFVLARLARRLNVDMVDMYHRLEDGTVSPYKPVAVAYNVPEDRARYIEEHVEDFPGVVIEKVWQRSVVRGNIAPHILGFTNQIDENELKDPLWKGYDPGDIIGKAGAERTFDAYLRGEPRRERVVVDSAGDPNGKPRVVDEEVAGMDVRLTISPRIQKITQSALTSGVMAARATGYQGRSGAAVVMDPNNGDVLAMASYPTYDAKVLANGYSTRVARALGVLSVDDSSDDALLNRPLLTPLQPGSTFKPITTAAALELGVVEPYEYIPCPPVFTPPGSFTEFENWTTSDLGSMSIPEALEQSCNTVFFNLGSRMESRWGINGDNSLKFQHYIRNMGIGHTTGIELPEHGGFVPDPSMCDIQEINYCPEGEYLPGYTVNAAVGQGDLTATPMQMAVAYSSLVNGGRVLEPRIVSQVERSVLDGKPEVVEEFEPVVRNEIGLDDTETSVIRAGMQAVVTTGTASDAFAGFNVSVGGKTGTAQVGEEDGLSNAWFISYAPVTDPQYVTAVYVELAGNGGETAAPIAREIYDGIFNNDRNTSVTLGSDDSD